MSSKLVTAAQVRERLNYDPQTGVFSWRVKPRSAKHGEAPGGYDRHGYLMISIGYRKYFAHRLAWLYVTGEWPREEIDHINGRTGDNRFDNLREATRRQDLMNTRPHKGNRSGIKGVSWYPQTSRWHARIQFKGKQRSLGYYHSRDDAAAAYAEAAKMTFGEFAKASA